MIVATEGAAWTTRPCPICRQPHLTFQRRTDGMGFVCGYRTPDEHYHDSYEELRVCQGTAPEKMAARAARSAAARKGTRGRYQRPADKPRMPANPSEVSAA